VAVDDRLKDWTRAGDLVVVVPLDERGSKIEVLLHTNGTGVFLLEADQKTLAIRLTNQLRHEIAHALLPAELART